MTPQQTRSGGCAAPFAVAATLPSVYRQGDRIVLNREGLPLPSCHCFKCNEPASHRVRKTYSSPDRFLFLLLTICPILVPVILPLHIIRRKRTAVEFGICDQCRERRLAGLVTGSALLLASVPLFTFAFLTLNSTGIFPFIGGAVLLGLGLFALGGSNHIADAQHADDRRLLLRGGGEAFLRSLPETGTLS